MCYTNSMDNKKITILRKDLLTLRQILGVDKVRVLNLGSLWCVVEVADCDLNRFSINFTYND